MMMFILPLRPLNEGNGGYDWWFCWELNECVEV